MKRILEQTAVIFTLLLLVSCGSGQQPSHVTGNSTSSASSNNAMISDASQEDISTAPTGTSQPLITQPTGSTMVQDCICSGSTANSRPGDASGAGGSTGSGGMMGQPTGGTTTSGCTGPRQGTGTTGSTGGEENAVTPVISVVIVIIDILPGGDPNSINPENEGVTPVAILSSATFDAPAVVDAESLTFGSTGNEQSLVSCGSVEDVNSDGVSDLVCQFTTRLTNFKSGDTEGILKGRTTDGGFFEGKDSVRIVQ